MKKTIFIILIVILVLIIALFGVYVYKNFFTSPRIEETTQPQELIGGQTDEYGCLIAAGYSWCEIKQKCLRIWEEYCGPAQKEPIFELLKNLRLEVELSSATGFANNFNNPEDADFKWFFEQDGQIEDIQISGLAIQGFETTTDINQVENYLKANGFEVDKYNLAAGTVGSATGYTKDNLVCLVSQVMSEFNPNNPNYAPPATEQPIPQNPDIIDITVSCGIFGESSSQDWQTYQNNKYNYSFKYPKNCLLGPLPGECKQKPPEQRDENCLCFLNPDNPDSVTFQTFTGPKDNLSGASFIVNHSDTAAYQPSPDVNLIDWLKEKFSYQDIPDEINFEIDNTPAVKVYTPASPMAYAQDDIYFIQDNKLLHIYMIDVDNQSNQELYNTILDSFKLGE